MFSGIIEEVGQVLTTEARVEGGLTIRLAAGLAAGLRVGESVAVNGVCLTVTHHGSSWFTADLSPTTLGVTALGQLTPGDPVNLELSLRLGDRLSGHLVSGHVDGLGTILRTREDGGSQHLWVAYPAEARSLLTDKGSVTVDGVALTVVHVDAEAFAVTVIPHTRQVTTAGRWVPARVVHLEFDMVAKYVREMMAPWAGAGVSS